MKIWRFTHVVSMQSDYFKTLENGCKAYDIVTGTIRNKMGKGKTKIAMYGFIKIEQITVN